MYHYVTAGVRYLVWVDLGFSFYSSRSYLEDISAALSLPLWDVTKVPDAEFVLYPLSSVPTVIAAAVPQRYAMVEGDMILYSTTIYDTTLGYECDRCGVWQVGEQKSPICYQCQFMGRVLLIGLGPDVDPDYISIANRSPGTVVRMDVPGVCILMLQGVMSFCGVDQSLPPDLVIEDIPYKFNEDGSVSQIVMGIEQGKDPYIFWGKILDYPGRLWTLRYGDWARYSVYVYCGQAVWSMKPVLPEREKVLIKRKIRKKQKRYRALMSDLKLLLTSGKNKESRVVSRIIAENKQCREKLVSQLECKDYLSSALVTPAPRLLIRRMMADWHDTTMHLTLATVPLVECMASIMPRTISSAKGIDDGKVDLLLEECEWL